MTKKQSFVVILLLFIIKYLLYYIDKKIASDSTTVEFGCKPQNMGKHLIRKIKCILFNYMKFPSSVYILS